MKKLLTIIFSFALLAELRALPTLPIPAIGVRVDSSGVLISPTNGLTQPTNFGPIIFTGNVSNQFGGVLTGLVSGAAVDSANALSADFNARVLEDNLGIVSEDWQNRRLSDGSRGDVAIDWNARFLWDSVNNYSENWDARFLYDFGCVPSINWGNRYMKDASRKLALDWQNRWLQDGGGGTSLDWANRQTIDNTGTPSMDWNARVLEDITGAPSVDWYVRQLKLGSAVILDWSSGVPFSPSVNFPTNTAAFVPIPANPFTVNVPFTNLTTARLECWVNYATTNSVTRTNSAMLFTNLMTGRWKLLGADTSNNIVSRLDFSFAMSPNDVVLISNIQNTAILRSTANQQ